MKPCVYYYHYGNDPLATFSCLCNCKVLHILFIRRAALCSFLLCCCLALFPALPGRCDLWAPSPFCLWLVQTSNEYLTYSPQLCVKYRNKYIFLFISTIKSKLTLSPSCSLSWICSPVINLKRNLIYAYIYIKCFC